MKTFILSLSLLFVINTYGQWNQLYPPDDIYTDVDFYDEFNGYLISSFEVYQTIDGGLSWSLLNIPNKRARVHDILMVKENLVWLTTDDNHPGSFHIGGSILKSVDGGITWETKFDIDFYGLRQLFFLNESIGWVTTDYKRVFCTTDGGDTWIESDTIPMYHGNGIYFVDDKIGWVCGGDSREVICKTTNGGISWETQFEQSSGNGGLLDIEFINEQKGFATGLNRLLLLTNNGGETWEIIASSASGGVLNALPINYAVMDIDLIDPDIGWITGGPVCGALGQYIMSSVDGGDSWQMEVYNDFLPYPTFNELDFIESGQGWAAGWNGLLATTQSQVNVQEAEKDPSMKIFPNPARGHVYINSEKDIVKVSLYNELGELLYKNESVNTKGIMLDLTEYQSGVYFVEVDNSVQKLLKQ